MCFSAGASFGAAAILSVTGFIALKKQRTPAQLPFAMIPLLFAVQQFSEGVFWLTATDRLSPAWEMPALLFFVVFAQVVWPVWVPLSIFLVEPGRVRRRVLAAMIAAAGLLSAYHVYCIASYPVTAEIEGGHIDYRLYFPSSLDFISSVIYFIVTIVPPFISGVRHMRTLGIAVFLSFLVTALFYRSYIISVWCFFAAIISVIVLLVLDAGKEKGEIAALPETAAGK